MQVLQYDLKDPLEFAQFLQDADVRLIRLEYHPQLISSPEISESPSLLLSVHL